MANGLVRTHGGVVPDSRELELAPANRVVTLDLSTCVDAFGLLEPVERALQVVERTQAHRHYPDPESRLARGRLGALLHVAPDGIDVGPGAAEQIWTLVRTCLGSRDVALVWSPCFSEFAHAVAAAGGHLVTHLWGDGPLDREVAAFGAAVAASRPKLAYLCAPTCPRGQWVPAELLREVSANNPDTLFIVDQSYLGLSRHAAERDVHLGDNVVRLRSVTKELGLPGIRVGYALMNPNLRVRLQNQRPHWALGTHAQAVLEVYAECQTALAARRTRLLDAAARLASELATLGLGSELRDTHYFAVAVATPRPVNGATESVARVLGVAAADVVDRLRKHAIAVRDCTSFGLPEHVRVVAHPEQDRLVAALACVVREATSGVRT